MFVPRRKLSNTIHRLRSAAHAINFCVYRIAGIKSNSAIFLKERDFSIFDAIIARPLLVIDCTFLRLAHFTGADN